MAPAQPSTTTIPLPDDANSTTTSTTLVDPANPQHTDSAKRSAKYPKDPFSRPWGSPEEERAALQAFADEKSHVAPGTDGTWMQWNAVGGGVKAMEWGGVPASGEESVYGTGRRGSKAREMEGASGGHGGGSEIKRRDDGEGEGTVKKMLHGLMGRRKSSVATGEAEERREGGGDGIVR